MYSKIANLFQFKGSLIKKLMALYFVSVLTIIVAVSLFLYPTFLEVVSQLTNSNIIQLCYKRVVLALLLCVIATIIISYIIARNGLSRLREFSTKLDSITPDSLDQRINPDEWPHEIKQVADKFNSMLTRIQRSYNQLSQFSSDIAHELRNPINNLMGVTESALYKDKSIEEYKKTLEDNHEELISMTKLIDNLFFLAHADHGELKIDKKFFNAKESILKIYDFYQAAADENNIILHCEGEGNVLADPTLFKRIISNLLSNALKYSQSPGAVTIKVEQNIKDTKISVTDNGIGIASEHINKLFDRFYRVDPARSAHSGGLGLGLSIVKSIIDLHQGKIAIESTPEIGTLVSFSLPR